jgi:putative FmdB family regulatory protein
MPIFEYECKACGHRFEELVMSSSQEIRCPACGSCDVEKLFSAFARNCNGCDSGGSHT